MYNFLADSFVAMHVAYIGYVVLGQLAIFVGWILGWRWVRNPWFRVSQFLMMAYVVYEQIMDIRCPLTVWEEHYRELAGQTVKGETFLGRLLHNLIFIDAEPWVFGAIYYGFGSIVLITLIFCPPRFRRRKFELAAATNRSSSSPTSA